MTFAEKLKALRKQTGMSQEKLAEKLNVSRQAVTKWETDAGIPDVENLRAISALFNISIDELLSNEKGAKRESDYLYESVTEYDIDEPKRFDMQFGGAKQLVLSGYDGEKIHVRLASNALPTLQSDFKVKIDDVKDRIDLDVDRRNGVTEAEAKDAVAIFVQLPQAYLKRVELAAHAETVEIHALKCEDIELDIKAPNVVLEDVVGAVENDCNLDMNVVCHSMEGEVAINQLSSNSRICIPEGTVYRTIKKGIGTGISFEKNGKPAEPFDAQNADNIIELNGFKSELIICTFQNEEQQG